ncbi:MAG TPA: amidohydrolase/deacetylase family metallohydrolase [Chloroflexota bacterium]|jgi:dihydroorotase|nr:amidohydrolase/deacetylase family metallohydrolase [Chloroflexota bacterium]
MESTSAAVSDRYDLVLQGGHVIDPANHRDEPADVAIANGRIARVARGISTSRAARVVDVSDCYVVPGLIDIHVHYFATCPRLGVSPDDHAFPGAVTTAVDTGTAGWRNFERFRREVIDRVKCRVLAYVNIVSTGMEIPANEQDPWQMEPAPAAEMARRHADVVVGIKTAHYMQPGWTAVDRAIAAGEMAGLPVMFDFAPRPERSYADLLLKKMRPGDIHTHIYARHIPSIDENGKVYDYIWEARRRGVILDLGHGAGSFWYRLAVPCIEQGYFPDTISTDQHTGNVNGPVFTMLHTVSKMLNLGIPLADLIYRSTVAPARAIGRPELGTLSEGAEADVAVIRLQHGRFGYWDCGRGKMIGHQKLECMLTIRAGQVVYDPHGLTMDDWRSLGPNY